MIAHFSDHAANERTFLAWVRTAIAVMAFGFLVAKFDLFLKIAARSLAVGDRQMVSLPRGNFGGAVGAVLITAGTVMVALAAVRLAHTRRAIDSANSSTDYDTVGADLALAAIMVVLGLALVLYLVHTLLGGI
jgi:putative membrane protein